jgi:hypothetical protein
LEGRINFFNSDARVGNLSLISQAVGFIQHEGVMSTSKSKMIKQSQFKGNHDSVQAEDNLNPPPGSKKD